MTLLLTSPSFGPGGDIPAAYTCEGADVSPELRWSGLPKGTASLVLVVDDPDAPDPAAPKRTWVHWVVYDLPPSAPGLPQDVHLHGMPGGARDGKNDWGRTGYGGPCPPVGRHRYFFKLYALDAKLGDRGPLTKAQVEQAMKGHLLASTELIGRYQKHKR